MLACHPCTLPLHQTQFAEASAQLAERDAIIRMVPHMGPLLSALGVAAAGRAPALAGASEAPAAAAEVPAQQEAPRPAPVAVAPVPQAQQAPPMFREVAPERWLQPPTLGGLGSAAAAASIAASSRAVAAAAAHSPTLPPASFASSSAETWDDRSWRRQPRDALEQPPRDPEEDRMAEWRAIETEQLKLDGRQTLGLPQFAAAAPEPASSGAAYAAAAAAFALEEEQQGLTRGAALLRFASTVDEWGRPLAGAGAAAAASSSDARATPTSFDDEDEDEPFGSVQFSTGMYGGARRNGACPPHTAATSLSSIIAGSPSGVSSLLLSTGMLSSPGGVQSASPNRSWGGAGGTQHAVSGGRPRDHLARPTTVGRQLDWGSAAKVPGTQAQGWSLSGTGGADASGSSPQRPGGHQWDR